MLSAGKAVGILAETLFVLLLILLSKGWTVVRLET